MENLKPGKENGKENASQPYFMCQKENGYREDERIDDIVAMLDEFMSQGGGHMNIRVDGDGKVKTVTKTNSNVCAQGDLACRIPNLEDGVVDTEQKI